jgi:T5SS/PEP-CTERM-associated repeat protein
MGLRIADGNGPVAGAVTVSGVGSSIVVSSTSDSPMAPYVIVGNGGNGQMTISDGATVSVLGNGQRNFIVSNRATGSGVLTMTNGATIVASRFAIADNGGSGSATIDNSTINLDGVIFNNGLDQGPNGAGVRIARGVGANGLLTMQNGAVININNTIDSSSVILGGTSTLPGGTGTLNMSGGSAIHFAGPAASAALQVGGASGTGVMTMTGGSTVNVGANRRCERGRQRRQQRHADGRRRLVDHGQLLRHRRQQRHDGRRQRQRRRHRRRKRAERQRCQRLYRGWAAAAPARST